ncbi:MAG: baseplate J/gp47 family protein [Hungatella sp.]|jgi:hypothetical protein|nr:baseplate J/gp47 family protein [Hungatella sp.]
MQNLDIWTKEQMIEQIREKAASYVPEWRFDTQFPDIGTALALVYAQMQIKTANKFSQVFLKNRIAFLNELDARLLPAVPAEGYVTFSLVNDEVEGVELSSGTIVNAHSEDEETGLINYRTLDDVYVSPVSVETIYHVCDHEDFIGRAYEYGTPWEEIPLFDLSRPNLQRHELYFSHEEALYIKEDGWIQLSFYLRGEIRVPEEILRKLADTGCAHFEYYSENGYEAFKRQKFENGTILLHKDARQPAFARTETDGTEGYFIRCAVTDMEALQNLEFARMTLRTWGSNILPDSIYANGMENNKKHYFPFGERLTNFNEVYFGCGEALCKKGAEVSLAFNLSFAKIPMDYNTENDPVKWEWIMKRSDFKSDPEYDVTIEEVLWEYYNGTGWARLFPDNRYTGIFFPDYHGDGEYKKIEFLCPKDMELLVVNSCESCYIRARIIKVNNLFKLKGSYISPIMEDTIFEYDYLGHEVEPDHIIACNNLEMERIPRAVSGQVPARPFTQTGTKNQALYLGFGMPLENGPLKILFMIKDNMDRTEHNLLWEYYGGGNWKELNVVDETKCFSKSGIVTVMGRNDFVLKRLFGREKYWLRITESGNACALKSRTGACPVIEGIHMNTTKVINVDKAGTELFRMEVYQENSRFALSDRRIIKAEVFVNEVNDLSAGEFSGLMKERRLKPVYDEAGILREAWVQWNQVEDFSESRETSRDYVLDKNEGLILFGNGRHGRIPPSSRAENIRVEYLSGGGEHTNVKENQIRQMNQEIGFINSVRNPRALAGGCNIESLHDALVRNSAKIRHQNRAITARDYEEIAMAASRNIKKVKCFSGYGIYGQKSPGAITLVVLQKDFEQERGRFSLVKDEVEAHLKDKADGNLFSAGKLAVIEPEFVELSVRAEITVSHYNAAFGVKKQVYDRLTCFFNPLTGNYHGQGWEIGQLPNNIQIKNAIGNIPELLFVRNIYISAFAEDSKGRREVDLEQIGRNRYILPVSGTHEVVIDVR